MTIATTTAYAGPFYANGVTTVFPFAFKAFAKAEIRVFTVAANGAETDISNGSFDVALNPSGGGSVIITPPLTAGTDALFIESNPAFTQNISFENQGAFRAPVHTEGLDRAAARDIWLRGRAVRAVLAPVGEAPLILPPAATRANAYFAFDSAGNIIPAFGAPGSDPLLRAQLTGYAAGSFIAYGYAAKYAPVWQSLRNKLSERVSARDFGAIADGAYHPLSERFTTLAAAQAVYPFATSLTQTLDWAGAQTVLNLARDSRATNKPVVAYLPSGRYLISNSLRMFSNVYLCGDKGGTIIDNQNYPLSGPQLTNDDATAFQYTQISGIQFNGGTYGVLIDAQTTEGNMMEDCSFALQTVANYQTNRLAQTSTWTRCVFQYSPYGVVFPGAFTNQVSFYSCEFNVHSWESIRITGSGEGVHFYGCRIEAGGVVGRTTITLANVRNFRWYGGYIEGTHTNLLSETVSTDTVSFDGVHFTGATDGIAGFAAYVIQSDGMVTITNSHGYFPIVASLNCLLVGSNPQVIGTAAANIWRYKDIMGGKVKLRQRNPRLEPTHSLLRVSLASAEGVHSIAGTLRLSFLGLDTVNGTNHKSYRTYQIQADNYGALMTFGIKVIIANDDQLSPIQITLREKPGSATATQVDLEVVYFNIFNSQPIDAFSLVSVDYEAMNSNEANPIRVIAL